MQAELQERVRLYMLTITLSHGTFFWKNKSLKIPKSRRPELWGEQQSIYYTFRFFGGRRHGCHGFLTKYKHEVFVFVGMEQGWNRS